MKSLAVVPALAALSLLPSCSTECDSAEQPIWVALRDPAGAEICSADVRAVSAAGEALLTLQAAEPCRFREAGQFVMAQPKYRLEIQAPGFVPEVVALETDRDECDKPEPRVIWGPASVEQVRTISVTLAVQ